ncbi:MAG: hypothetical protein WCY67_02990 [Acidithiobacillus sp.]
MIKKISAGLSVALMTLALPNALAWSALNMPSVFLSTFSRETNFNDNTPTSPGEARSQKSTQHDSNLLINNNIFHLQRVTAYNAVSSQTNNNPGISACGPTRPDQIALSQDLFMRKNGGNRCGEKIDIILSSGKIIRGVVWDTMNPRYHMAADILMFNAHQAMSFGVKTAHLRFVNTQTPTTSDV